MIKQIFSSSRKPKSSPFDSSSKKKKHVPDRFIPHSVSKNLYNMFCENESNLNNNLECHKIKYTSLLEQSLVGDQNIISQNKVLHFGQDSNQKQNCSQNIGQLNDFSHLRKKRKKVSKEPFKILQAPYLRDDFYLNLVDWSDTNHIGVGLQNSLYVWSGCSSKVKKIYESENTQDYVGSVNFFKHNPKVAIGTSQGKIKIFDIYKTNQCKQFSDVHYGRIGSISCTNNLIVTGGRDGYVSIHDYRIDQQIFRYKAHNQQISGLKICPNNEMIATGGNDNRLLLFSMKKMDKMACWSDHKAAVKAIGFNPKHPSIASGGGTADKRIRIFSLQTLEMINQVDTGSQICNLMFSPISNQLVTTHGYSLNQITLWKWDQYGQLDKIDSVMGHKNRVLYLAGESQGGKIVTGAGDQELRLWKIFDESQISASVPYDLR